MELPDYYALLGVKPDAARAEIRLAFRRLALVYHPDTQAGAAQTGRFRQIVEAHAVLSDPERRARYDADRSGAARDTRSESDWPSFEEWVARYSTSR